MKKIQVLVIDDSAFMRRVISDIISEHPRCEVVSTASNGKEGLEKVKTFQPDVVTLDVEMPVMDGLQFLKAMNHNGEMLPVIMVSTLTKEGAKETLDALELGAVDFITKPSNIFKMKSDEINQQVVDKIIAASSVVRKNIQPIQRNKMFTRKENIERAVDQNKPIHKCIAIGTSTGGPKALQQVIPYLPKDLNGSILIVQHMPPGFTKSLAERLDQLSEVHVKEAEDGEIISNGVAYIAPGNCHMELIQQGRQYKIHLNQNPPVGGHRPCVDVLYHSIAKLKKLEIIGVIMTGMGSDGCKGMVQLKKETEVHIIAQDEESSVVYGMPKAVVEKGIADEIVSLEFIANQIIKKVGVL